MYRTVTVEVKVKLLMKVDEGVEIGDIISEMDYDFTDTTGSASIEDTYIIDHEVMDSR